MNSFRFALSGLAHAFSEERNLQGFLLLNLIIVIIGILVKLPAANWIVLLLFSLMFIVVELLNTAMERLADTIDDCQKRSHGGHYHLGIKMAKDTAAAASLVALTIFGMIVALFVAPQFVLFILGGLT